MPKIIDTIYSGGDMLIVRLKECESVTPIIIEHTSKSNESITTANCFCSTALIISITIAFVAIVVSVALIMIKRNDNKYAQLRHDKNIIEKYQDELNQCLKEGKGNDEYFNELRNAIQRYEQRWGK